jgi:Dihydrodipicolinate reductase, N-terminus
MEPMADPKKIRVGVNGYGVIGKRVAAAVARQEDMSLAGVSDVVTDWRASTALRNGFRLFGATAEYAAAMRAAGLDVTGTLDELLGQADVVVDCTPKRIAAKNIDMYRRRGLKFIVQGGEKHEATGHSFVAEANYATALDRDATRVVSCNTTSIVRTLSSLKRAGLLQRARGTLLRALLLSICVIWPNALVFASSSAGRPDFAAAASPRMAVTSTITASARSARHKKSAPPEDGSSAGNGWRPSSRRIAKTADSARAA